MDKIAGEIIERQTALADFDHARDDFESALSSVPNEALDYKPEGDDYSISDLVPHVTGSINMYSVLLDLMKEAEYREVKMAGAVSDDEQVEAHKAPQASVPLSEGEGHRANLETMEAAHDALAAKLRDLEEEQYSVAASVYYPGAEEPYPTRASDILDWLTDHYREHAQQVLDMLDVARK
ncbi:MAG: DinB family protein [Chloroflexi bacterium]|nr:DinB family protein [Chloroflexota bacterium]